jgi:hypothetical protein
MADYKKILISVLTSLLEEKGYKAMGTIGEGGYGKNFII